MLWAVGGLVLVLGGGALALQFAAARNGPAVLSTIDSFAGTGTGTGAELTATIPTGEHPAQKLIIWGPATRDPGAPPLPVILFVHGGSWRNGDPVDYGFVARAFTAKGFMVALAGYRLGADGKYPAMIEDTASAFAATHETIAQYGGNPDRITLAGHSAGAYNSVMIALEHKWLEQHGLSSDAIAAVVGMSGPYDFHPFKSDSTIAAFGEASDPEGTQPVAHARKGAPPMLLLHGEKDDLVKPRNTIALAERIEAAGGEVATRLYPTMEHNDPLISLAAPWRSRRDVVDHIADFALKASERRETSVQVHSETR